MNFWQRTYNVLHTFYAKLYFSYLTKPQVDEVRKYFGPNLPSVWEMKPALVLINSHIVLNGIQPMTPAAVQVGGIHIRDDDTPLSPVRQFFRFIKLDLSFHFRPWNINETLALRFGNLLPSPSVLTSPRNKDASIKIIELKLNGVWPCSWIFGFEQKFCHLIIFINYISNMDANTFNLRNFYFVQIYYH